MISQTGFIKQINEILWATPIFAYKQVLKITQPDSFSAIWINDQT